MSNKNKDFNKLLAGKFKKKEFAQAYIMGLVNEESLNLEEALRESAVLMGLQVFADKTGISMRNLSDFISKKKRLTFASIEQCLRKGFDLQVKMRVEAVGAKGFRSIKKTLDAGNSGLDKKTASKSGGADPIEQASKA